MQQEIEGCERLREQLASLLGQSAAGPPSSPQLPAHVVATLALQSHKRERAVHRGDPAPLWGSAMQKSHGCLSCWYYNQAGVRT